MMVKLLINAEREKNFIFLDDDDDEDPEEEEDEGKYDNSFFCKY